MSSQTPEKAIADKRDHDQDPRALMTARFLAQAGFGAPIRVLDVGCGIGSISILLSRLMGGGGEIVAIDREPRMVAMAAERAQSFGLANITFVEGDFADAQLDLGLFDATVGRRVLMYQTDPVEAVRRLAERVVPGGLVFFEELDSTPPAQSARPLLLHDTVRTWLWSTLDHMNTQMHMGLELFAVLEAAGLSNAEVRAEAVIKTPTGPDDTADVVRFLMPRIVAAGVATEAEIDIETLDERLRRELADTRATYVSDLVFGAWARTSGP